MNIIPREEARSIEVIRSFGSICVLGEVAIVLALFFIADKVIQVREARENHFFVIHVIQTALQEIEEHVNRRNVQIGIVAVARVEIGIRSTRPGLGCFAIVLNRQLKVVVRRIGDLENARQPHVDIIRDSLEFSRQLFTEEAELIRTERVVPEKKAVELDILETLRDGVFERVEEFIEICGVNEFCANLFGCVARA